MAILIGQLNLQACPSTDILKGLNDQLLQEFNAIPGASGKLVSIKDLDVTFGSAAIPFVGGPTAKDRLIKAIKSRPGVKLHINHAYRTVAQQFLLYREFHFGRTPNKCHGMVAVARPGMSNHESGLALDIDIPLSWKPFLQPQGWTWFGPKDPPHYDFIGGTNLRSLGVKAFQSLWNRHNPTDQIVVDGDFGNPATSETAKRLLKTPVDGFS